MLLLCVCFLSYLSYYSLPLAKAMKVSENYLFNYRLSQTCQVLKVINSLE